jgi:hypothetical protein
MKFLKLHLATNGDIVIIPAWTISLVVKQMIGTQIRRGGPGLENAEHVTVSETAEEIWKLLENASTESPNRFLNLGS